MNVTKKSVPQECSACGNTSQAKKGAEAVVLAFAILNDGTFVGLDTNGDGESADQNLPSQPGDLCFGFCTHRGDDSVVSAPGDGMVECVAAHQEDLCEFFVVVGHHGRLWGLFGHGQEIMDIFDGTKSLLPQFQLDGGIELGEAGIEVVLEGIGVGKVNGMGLRRVFGYVGEVEAKCLT